MSDVPSLAQLCGDFITQTAIIDLRNAPEMLEFAMQHDVQALCQRAQQFITTCWSAMQDIHSPDALRACLGDELYAKLAEEQAETERGVRRLSLVGEVLEKPAASSEPVTPLRTASGRQTYPYEQARLALSARSHPLVLCCVVLCSCSTFCFSLLMIESSACLHPCAKQLRTSVARPPGVGAEDREEYLSDEAFERLFSMSRAAFRSLPGWKRSGLKKKVDLF